MQLISKCDDRVRQLAHRLWEKDGKPHGRNEEFWDRAQQEISALLECDCCKTVKHTNLTK